MIVLRWCDVTCIMHCGGVSKHVLTPEIDPGPAGCALSDGGDTRISGLVRESSSFPRHCSPSAAETTRSLTSVIVLGT